MKTLKSMIFFALISLSSVNAQHPQQIPLEEGDMFLEAITTGQLVSQRLMCEDNSCIINGTIATVELPLGGCLDRLGHVTYTTHQVGNVIRLIISATNIANQGSLAALCFKMPSQLVEFTMIDTYGRVEVEFLRPIVVQ